jgi:hypothetical protein
MSRKLGQYPRRELTATTIVNPAKARIMILESLDRHAAFRPDAAYELNVSIATFNRLVLKLELKDAIAKIDARHEKNGTHHSQTVTEKKRKATFHANGTNRGRRPGGGNKTKTKAKHEA